MDTALAPLFLGWLVEFPAIPGYLHVPVYVFAPGIRVGVRSRVPASAPPWPARCTPSRQDPQGPDMGIFPETAH